MGSRPRNKGQGKKKPPSSAILLFQFSGNTKTRLASIYQKLLALQKRPGNDHCCDCPAVSPQWASPKFGTFICLECAGRHRGLGVHISFVRSITMDAFKGGEIARMDLGGNAAWRKFWEEKRKESGDGNESGRKWEDIPLEEKYGGEVAEEWKERLACKAEGREFTGVVRKPGSKRIDGTTASPAITSRGSTTPMRTASPGIFKQKERNEEFFARIGSENAARSADLPPSRGGKYAGFGSEPVAATHGPGSSTSTTSGTTGEAGVVLPGVDEFQKDPVAALTKGFGWFTATVGKGAKTVNDGWIQPTAQKVYILYKREFFSFFFSPLMSYISLSLFPMLTKGLTNRFFPKNQKIKKDSTIRYSNSSSSHSLFPSPKYSNRNKGRSRAIF